MSLATYNENLCSAAMATYIRNKTVEAATKMTQSFSRRYKIIDNLAKIPQDTELLEQGYSETSSFVITKLSLHISVASLRDNVDADTSVLELYIL